MIKMKINFISATQQMLPPITIEDAEINQQTFKELQTGRQEIDDEAVNVILTADQLVASDDTNWLLDIKMYQSVFQANNEVDATILKLLHQIGSFDYRNVTTEQFDNRFKNDFLRGQNASRVLTYATKVNSDFVGTIQRDGVTNLKLNGQFQHPSAEFKTLITLPQLPVVLDSHTGEYFLVNLPLKAGYEYDLQVRLHTNINLKWRLLVFFTNDGKITAPQVVTENEQLVRVPDSQAATLDYFCLLQVQGTDINLNFAGVDATLHRTVGLLIPGDHTIRLNENEDVDYYFYNPHPDRPAKKLIIGFAGYRAWSRRFEMTGVLPRLGQPIMTITDFRARGGAFYLNSYENMQYEDAVVKEIDAQLKRLGLTRKDAITMGFSMGSTGAIHYAIKMGLGNAFAMKPIVSLGKFTAKTELAINIGETWIFEARRFLAGRNSRSDRRFLDSLVWQPIRERALTQTKIHLFTLLEDEFDGESTDALVALLREKKELGEHFWAHGRHRARTDEALDWFLNNARDVINGTM